MKECVTHHYACECREERFRKLLEAAKRYKEKYFDRAENQDELTDEAKALIRAITMDEGAQL